MKQSAGAKLWYKTRMITICHATDEVELILIRSALEAAAIPHFIVGNYFGSLYPGIQPALYNERPVQTPPEYAAQAREIIEQLRADRTPTEPTTDS